MNDAPPSAGERAAVAGYSAQYGIAAEIVRRQLRDLQWIRLADPNAGVADDFQFATSSARHAVQVKWAQYPDSFSWSDLFGTTSSKTSLFGDLAVAWRRLRADTDGALHIHLCSNRYASSAAPTTGSPLQQVTAPGPHHLAAFLARSFQPVQQLIASGTQDWSAVEELDLVQDWRSAWDRVRAAAGELSDVEFIAYLAAIEVRLGIAAPHELLTDLELASDQQHIAQTIQSLVADARQVVHLTRDQLLAELGWSSRLAYRHPHRFPVPDTYTPNAAALASLVDALKMHDSGYLALLGAAGSGKSTLLESFKVSASIVRYYAFVPDSPEPISARGEAQAFLNDLNLALQETGLHSRQFGADLTGQRSVLTSLLEDAHRRHEREGRATIVIVDGLDHISREQSPTRSLIDELPAAGLLRRGVYFALGSQSVEVLPPRIRDSLEEARRIVIPPLVRHEVDQVIDKSGVGEWITPPVRDALHDESEGHPLALTYLLQDLADVEDSTDSARDRNSEAMIRLEHLTAFRGGIRRRYDGYFASVGGDAALIDLLAIVARVRAPLRLDWLVSWTSTELAEKFAHNAYPFFARAGEEWHFIHNSFRLFLVEKTSTVGGIFNDERDRLHHARTADLCAASSSLVYRDEELSHRYLAGDLDRVVSLATPEALRSKLLQLRPTRTVRAHANIALRAAAELGDVAAMVPLFLFVAELAQRDYILSPSLLAEVAAEVLPVEEVREHLIQRGRLTVEDEVAFRAASRLARAGSYLLADELLRAVENPLLALGKRNRGDGNQPEATTAWTQAHYSLGGFDRVLDALSALDGALKDDLDEHDDETDVDLHRSVRQHVLARCSELAAEVKDNGNLDRIAAEVAALGDPNWIARMHVVRAQSAAEDGLVGQVTEHASALIELDQSPLPIPPALAATDSSLAASENHLVIEVLRHAMLEVLLRSGLGDLNEASILASGPLVRRWPDTVISDPGLAPFVPYLATTRLALVLSRQDPVASNDKDAESDSRYAGRRRFETALRALAEIETLTWPSATARPETTPPISLLAEPVVRLLEVPGRQTRDWTLWYSFRGAAPELWERLLASAVESPYDTIESVLRLFHEAWSSSSRGRYWHPSMRTGVVKWVADHVPSLADWTRDALTSIDAEIDAATWDVHDRVDTWLRHARSWAAAGSEERARAALQSAVGQGWGPSQNDDNEQLSHYAEWLALAFESGAIDADTFVDDVLDFVGRVEHASTDASSQAKAAAEALTVASFRVNPGLGCELATVFCEMGVLEESTAIGSVIRGLAASGEGAGVAVAMYSHMLAPSTHHIPDSVLDDIALCAPDPTLKARLAWADSLRGRSKNEPRSELGEGEELADLDYPRVAASSGTSAVLRQMRDESSESITPAKLTSWAKAISTSTHLPSRAVAEALVEEGRRLQLTGPLMGSIIATCAAAGSITKASDALSEAMTQLPATGWWRRYDGGTRIALLKTALSGGDPELRRIGVNDFAGAITSGALPAEISIRDLVQILRVVVGDQEVGAAWAVVRPTLNVFAPSTDASKEFTRPTNVVTSEEAGAKWVTEFVGHPTRTVDFGAREVLAALIESGSRPAELATASLLAGRGWQAEGALNVFLRIASRGYSISDVATSSITIAAQDEDLIIRALAQEVLATIGVSAPVLGKRELPPSLRFSFPPLSTHKSYLLDAEGMAVVDMTNPLEVVAPYEDLLMKMATTAGLDPSAVLHFASEIARTQSDEWLAGGNKGQAERLKRRGQKLVYRPWALMVGRRAAGHVAALLSDTNYIHSEGSLATDMGLLDSVESVERLPLNESTPLPWREESVRGYDTRGWAEETAAAADAYADAYANRGPENFVLCEVGEWRSLAWETPYERRTISPLVGFRSAGLHLSRAKPVLQLSLDSRAYPEFSSGGQALIVCSDEFLSDPAHAWWIAMNPSFARRLRWKLSANVPFEWLGDDGEWRARTVLRVRGDLGFAPPADDFAASVWQVELSATGEQELRSVVPTLSRVLRVERRLKSSEDTRSATAEVEIP